MEWHLDDGLLSLSGKRKTILLNAVQQDVIKSVKAKAPSFRISSVSDVECAYLMAKHANVGTKSRVLDPFGGFGFSGIIVSLFKPKELVLNDILYEKEQYPRLTEEEWEKRNAGVKRTAFTLSSHDATSHEFEENRYDAIVTSPPYFLGKERSREDSMSVFEKSLPNLFKTLKPGGRLVVRIPSFWRDTVPIWHGFEFENRVDLRKKGNVRNSILVYRKPHEKRAPRRE